MDDNKWDYERSGILTRLDGMEKRASEDRLESRAHRSDVLTALSGISKELGEMRSNVDNRLTKVESSTSLKATLAAALSLFLGAAGSWLARKVGLLG